MTARVRRLLIAAALFAAPAPAAAAPTGTAAHHVDVDRLRLAGGHVLLEGRSSARTEAIDLVAPGRAPRRLAALRAGPAKLCSGDSGGDGVDFGFDASAQAIAASSICAGLDEPAATQVFAGPLGQPPGRLAACSPPGELLRPAVAVTGSLVAYVDSCAGADGNLVVHDLAGAPERRLTVPAGVNQYVGGPEALQAAGPFLAYDVSTDQGPAAGVLDLRSGDQQTVALAGDAAMTDLAVDAAGRVLVRREAAHDCGVVELHAQATAPAQILERCADDAGIGLAAGRAAYFAAGRLHVAGRVRARIARRVVAAHLAFDSSRVAYDVPECGGRRDVVVVGASGPPAARLSADCPFSIPPQRPRLSGSHVTVRAICPRGCADANLRLLSTRRRPLAVFTGFATPGAVQRLSLSRSAARTIRRRGSLAAILSVGVRRLDGRYRTRSRAVTIVAG